MKIIKIKILKSKINLSFDNNQKLSIDKDVFASFYLYEGKELSKEEYKKIIELNNSNKLLQYALKLRSKSLYSEYKLREKLYKKEASKKEVDQIIKIMKGYDLIDDKAYCDDLLEYYNSLNYGENKIKSKLADKGIFKERIEKIKFLDSLEKKKAKNLLPKLERKYDKYNLTLKKQHIYHAYIQEGYSIEISKEMVNNIKDNSCIDELNKLENDYQKIKNRLSKKYKEKELKQKILMALLYKGYKMNDIMKVMK